MKYRILILAMIVVTLFTCNGCIVEMYEDYKRENSRKDTTSSTEESTVNPQKELGSLFGVVTELDTENKLIAIRDINTDILVSYSYTGATDVRDKYDKIIAMALIEPGYIVEGEYRVDDNRLVKMSISDKAWENLRVHNWKYSQGADSLRIGNQTYELYEYKVVAADGEVIDIRELSEPDELIVRGYENKVYSISVLKGHGYVSLKNDAYFLGGIVTVGNDAGLEVTDDMLIMVGEGNHTLSVSKNGVGGSVEIEVKRNKEVVVDIGEFQGELEEYGSISFKIFPEGAKLYIDGREKKYDDLVELAFGTYKIAIEAEGYVPYIGDLVVSDTFLRKTISLGLEGEKEDEDKEEETTTATEEETSEGSGDSEEETTKDTTEETSGTDSENDVTTGDIDIESETTVIYTGNKDVAKYNIYIDTPTGAEVYFDSEYIGTTPVSIPKQSGIHTIIFKKGGYKTKAYTIEISADAQDEYFSFMAMVEEEE